MRGLAAMATVALSDLDYSPVGWPLAVTGRWGSHVQSDK